MSDDFIMIDTKIDGPIAVPRDLKIFAKGSVAKCKVKEWTNVQTVLANDLADLIASAKSGCTQTLRLSIVGLVDDRKNHVIWRRVHPMEDRYDLVKDLFMSQGYTFQYIDLALPDINGRNPMSPDYKKKDKDIYEIVMW